MEYVVIASWGDQLNGLCACWSGLESVGDGRLEVDLGGVDA